MPGIDDGSKRSLEELLLAYETDPTRRDVFVEGPYDASVVRWFLESRGVTVPVVYEVETVSIPDGELIQARRKANNRERAIYLGEYCARHAPDGGIQVTCVVDADFSHLRDDFIQSDCVLYTDHACMEMYFFRPDVVGKFLTVGCNKGNWPAAQVLDCLARVLQQLFLYRFANDELGWEMDWLDKFTCMCASGREIEFSRDEFAKRLLGKNLRLGQYDVFVAKAKELAPKLRDDPRLQMHGHDFVALFAWYLRSQGVQPKHLDPKAVQVELTLAADAVVLENERLFVALVKRVAS